MILTPVDVVLTWHGWKSRVTSFHRCNVGFEVVGVSVDSSAGALVCHTITTVSVSLLHARTLTFCVSGFWGWGLRPRSLGARALRRRLECFFSCSRLVKDRFGALFPARLCSPEKIAGPLSGCWVCLWTTKFCLTTPSLLFFIVIPQSGHVILYPGTSV